MTDAQRPISIYLAGPDVFLHDAIAMGQRKKDICAKHGFVGLFPFDNEIAEVPEGQTLDFVIYKANVAMIARADCAVFNLTPFRGAGADNGTVFELGMMVALGKPVFGYTNDPDDYRVRVGARNMMVRANGKFVDDRGMLVEDFGNADNLMIDNALRDSGAGIIRKDVNTTRLYDDLSGFEACIEAVAEHLRTHGRQTGDWPMGAREWF